VVIVMADGLGSATKSEIGASIAVDSAFRHCLNTIAVTPVEDLRLEDVVRDAAAYARQELERLAQQRSYRLGDLACTLIVVVVLKGRLALAHIGDGAVVAQGEGGLRLVSGPEESEYINEVVPLTSSEWQASLRIAITDGVTDGLGVFTDGLHRAAFRRIEGALVPFDGFFGPIFNYARQVVENLQGSNEISALLSSPKLSEHSDDDKTLVVAVLRHE
jgi:hypothetical protein